MPWAASCTKCSRASRPSPGRPPRAWRTSISPHPLRTSPTCGRRCRDRLRHCSHACWPRTRPTSQTSVAIGAESRCPGASLENIRAWGGGEGKAVLLVRAQPPGGRLEPGDVVGGFTGGDIGRRDVAAGVEERLVEDAYNPAV